jgi:hypothetical protein
MEEIKEEDICPICNDIAQNKTPTFVCAHIYCQTCITKWYFLCVDSQKEPHCPICRKVDNVWGKK